MPRPSLVTRTIAGRIDLRAASSRAVSSTAATRYALVSEKPEKRSAASVSNPVSVV